MNIQHVNNELNADLFFSFQINICIPVRIDRNYENNPDWFCHICGNVVLTHRQEKITDFMKNTYYN